MVGCFGLGAIVLGGLALVAGWLAHKKGTDQAVTLFLFGVGAAGIGMVLVWWGIRLALEIEKGYDPGDPNEPKIKF